MAGDFLTLKDADEKAFIDGIGGSNSTGIKGAKSTVFFNDSIDGEPRHEDLFAVRLLGRTGYIELLKDVIKDQVASTDFHVRPVIPEGEDREPSQREQDAADSMTQFFKGNFNSDNQSFDHLLKAILNDVLDFNTGAVELVSDEDGFLDELIVRDGLTFTKNLLDVGKLPEPGSGEPAYYQFSLSAQAKNFFRSDRQGIDIRDISNELSSLGFSRVFSRETRKFSRDEIAWFELDNRTGAPYGRGKTQKVKKQAENLINGDVHRSKFWQENEFHKGFVNVPTDMSQQDKQKLKKRFHGTAGDEFEMPVVGAEDAEYVSIDPNPEQMQFLESHKFYTKLAASIYGLNPNEIGFTEDSSRNVSEQQQKNVWNRTTQPTLEMIERVFTNQVLPFMREFNELEDMDFKFEFKPQNDFLEQIENDMIAQEEELGTLTLNEARERKGKEGFGEIGELPKPAFDSLATQNPGFVAEKFGIEDAPQNDTGQAPLFGNSFNNNDDDGGSEGTDSKDTEDVKTDDDDTGRRGDKNGEKVRQTDNQGSEIEKDVEDVDLTPPEAVKHAAETALQKKDEFSDDIGDCGTGVGESRARKIVNEDLEPEDFLGGENTAIPDYLESHEEDVNGLDKPTSEWTDDDWTGRSISSDGSPRCGPVQYALWGGVSTGTGLEWATSTEQELKEAQEDEEEQDSRVEESGNGDARDPESTSSYIDSYRKAFDRKDQVLSETKDALRNQHGFDDVDGVVSQKDDLKEDVATVFQSIDLEDAVREAFPETSQDEGLLVDADELVESVDFRDRLASVLESRNLETLELSAEHHEQEMEDEAEERLRIPDEVKVEIGFDVFDTFTADVIRQEALSNATEIEDTIRDRLKNEILEGAEQGDSIPDMIDRIQTVKDSFTDDHAELVARTETLSASRKGSQALAESTDLVGGKEWLATDDSRTREWHSVMDGTVVEKDDHFTVPKVSDEQPSNYPRTARVVGEDQPFNCRCSQAPVLAEDLPDELDAMQQLSGVELDMSITERQFEVWNEHSSFCSFKRFWEHSQERLSKSEMADRFGMSKPTVYSWSNDLKKSKNPEGVPEDAYPVQSAEDCPGSITQGPRGGLYCIPEDSENGDNETSEEMIENQPETSNKPPENLTIHDLESSNSLADEGITNATWAEDLSVGQRDDGSRIYMRDMEGARQTQGDEVANEIKDNIIAGSMMTRMLGGDSPSHYYHERQDTVASDGVEGPTFSEADANKIDRESYLDTASAGILSGNSDLHGGNLVVKNDGTVSLIDHDRAESSTKSIIDRTSQQVVENAQKKNLNINKKDVRQRVKEMAENAPDDLGENLPTNNSSRMQNNLEWARENL